MTRNGKTLGKLILLIPSASLFDLAGCQANVLRNVADQLNQDADRIDGRQPDLGDYLSDLVADL